MLTVKRNDRRHQFMHKLICYAEVASKVAQIKLFYRILEHWPITNISMLTVLRYCCVSSEFSPSDGP